VQRSARARKPEILTEVEELKGYLQERGKEKRPGRLRDRTRSEAGRLDTYTDLGELEAEIQRFPSSIQAYEELARALAARGNMSEAIDSQLHARALSLEILGLEALSARDPNVVRLYLAGAHRPALELIESIPESDPPPYPVDYLLGHCRLAVDRPEEARLAFQNALGRCDRQLHRTVLRALVNDVDAAYLTVARRSIQDKLESRAFAEAAQEAAAMMGRLRIPESALIDLARVMVEAADAALGSGAGPTPLPALPNVGALSARLADCLTAASDLGRARRLIELGLERDEPGRKGLEVLLRKVELVERQAAIISALAESLALARDGQDVEALAALDRVGPSGSADPRVLRQKALLLLKLERFDEAVDAAEPLLTSASPVAREFSSSFTALVFRRRMSVGCCQIRAGNPEEALRVLEPAVAYSSAETLELAYSRGCALAMLGYRLRAQGKVAEARERLSEAMCQIDGHVPAARAAGHSRLLELQEKLDKDLDN
jgi:tetratricopeptide (TPR) repeat protein